MSHRVSRLSLALAWTIIGAATASAGPNAGGVLVVDGSWYYGIPPECTLYVGDLDVMCAHPECFELVACSDAEARTDGTAPGVFFVYAAFPTGSSPRLAGLSFGLEYPSHLLFLDWGACVDQEESLPLWPQSGSGTKISFDTPRTGELESIYVVAAYNYYGGPGQIRLVPNLEQGASFFDDSVPPVEDLIADYGAMGFDMDGRLVCPGGAVGACCIDDAGCESVASWVCETLGGTYLGDGVICTPDICRPSPTIDSSWGTIKHGFDY